MPRKKKVEEIVVEETVLEETPKIKEEIEKTKKEKKKKVKVIALRVNVRKTPSLIGEILGVVSENEEFELLSDDDFGGFKCINWNGNEAYIMSELVK